MSLTEGGSVGPMLIDAFARHGARPAIADESKSWTYDALAAETARIIGLFRAIGLERGMGVSVLATNRVETWAVMCAAAIMGLRYTPLHPLAAEDDHAFIADDAEIALLIVQPDKFGERGRAIQARAPKLKHLYAFGPMEGARDFLAETAAATPAPLVADNASEDICWLAYTGGTTGRSKGVMIPHRAIVAMSLMIASDWDWPGDIRYLAVTPISHAAGITLFPVAFRGGFARLQPGFDLEDFCACVAREKITATFLVPTIIYGLIDAKDARARHDLSSLDMIVYGAAPMSPDRLMEGMEIFGRVFVQLYGQSEAPQIITTLRKVDHDPGHPERMASCGRANPLNQVKLFDADMNEVGVNQPGEICVRGPIVMNGYWKRPEATEEAFRGGWLHTGDVAQRDEHGFYYIVDRTKDMIISGGFNIYPREVEDALMSHSAVASACVIGVPDEKWGEAVTAFVILKDRANVGEAELQAHVREKRGAPWSPKSVRFVDAIPLTGLGKLDRKALRAPFWEGRARGVS